MGSAGRVEMALRQTFRAVHLLSGKKRTFDRTRIRSVIITDGLIYTIGLKLISGAISPVFISGIADRNRSPIELRAPT